MNVILFGAGLHAHYCIDIIEQNQNYNIVGIIDSILPLGMKIFDYEVIGRQEDLIELSEKYNFDSGLISIGENSSRKIVYDYIMNIFPKFNFINAIHPSTIIGKNVSLGKGIVTMAGCIINTSSIIGDFCFFATGAQIEHHCVIGSFVSISAGSVLGGKVKIGNYSALTLNVTVLDRITIGENTVVGAGAVVLKDLPNNVLAYGNPAKVIRERSFNDKILKSQ